jgi:hypothetical protein
VNLSTSLLLSMAELGRKVLSICLLSHLLTRKGAVSQVNLDEAQLLVDLFDTNKDMEVVRYTLISQNAFIDWF